jgi:phosphatidylglycerophosphatase C
VVLSTVRTTSIDLPSPPARSVNLALFDFDGTITVRDTFLAFIGFATSGPRLLAGKLTLSPLIVGYRMGVVPASLIRSAISWFAFAGVSASTLARLGEEFARRAIPELVRPRAREQIQWHKEQGDRVVIVSASLDVYLESWCKENGVEVICTRLQTNDGKMTGRYVGGDCSGEEKRLRVLQQYNIKEYALIYAYGDTAEDEAMLGLANRKFFRWQELRE